MTTTINEGGWRRCPGRLLLWAIPTALLIAPAVAMQFTREVQWDAAGAVIARFEARGMARAMTTAFVLNAGIAAAVPIVNWGAGDPPGTIGLTVLIGGFAAMWGLSAVLFAKAARDRT